jgi:hypothetical protein
MFTFPEKLDALDNSEGKTTPTTGAQVPPIPPTDATKGVPRRKTLTFHAKKDADGKVSFVPSSAPAGAKTTD